MNVFLIAALSTDGFIAPRTLPHYKVEPEEVRQSTDEHKSSSLPQPSTAWTSQEDKDFFTTKTKEVGVVIMGRTTYLTIPEQFRPLKHRLNIIYTNGNQLQPDVLPLNKGKLEGAESGQTAAYSTNLSPEQLINLLNDAGYQAAAICGGSSIYTLFMQTKLVNTLYLTIEPVLFGQGFSLLTGPVEAKLKRVRTLALSPQTVVMEYQVSY